MPKLIDLTGRRIGRLTIIGFSHRTRTYGRLATFWKCHCDCGNDKIIRGTSLKRGDTKSCGCIRRENTAKMKTTHGMKHTRIYGAWCRMRQRCENPNGNRYQSYGGRGIIVCERWQSFENFLDDMWSTWFLGGSLERINVNGNYEPNNCCWIPRVDQAKNRQNSIIIDTPWGTMNAMYVAEKLGLSPGTFYERIKKWPKERWLEPRHQSPASSD